eukprot:tig00020999_g16963.t1
MASASASECTCENSNESEHGAGVADADGGASIQELLDSMRPAVHVCAVPEDVPAAGGILAELHDTYGFRLCGAAGPCAAADASDCPARAFLLVARPATAADAACVESLDAAVDDGRCVRPVCFEEQRAAAAALPKALARRLAQFEWTALPPGASPADRDDAIESLAASLLRDARRPRGAPAPPGPGDVERDPALAAVARFARRELAVPQPPEPYVPPRAARPASKVTTDLRAEVNAFLAKLELAKGPDGRAPHHKVLLLVGDSGASKSTFLRRLHRESCREWAQPADGGAGPSIPPTVLVPLDEVADDPRPSGPLAALRRLAARRLGVPAAALPAIRDRFGLVLLLDGYDEVAGEGGRIVAGPVGDPNLWRGGDLGAWASGAVVACGSELRSRLSLAQTEAIFAPADREGGAARPNGLLQLTVRPLTKPDIDEYLEDYAELHEGTIGAIPAAEYESQVRI